MMGLLWKLRERPSSEIYDYCKMIGLLSRCEMEQCGSRSYRAERTEDDYICMCRLLVVKVTRCRHCMKRPYQL